MYSTPYYAAFHPINNNKEMKNMVKIGNILPIFFWKKHYIWKYYVIILP